MKTLVLLLLLLSPSVLFCEEEPFWEPLNFPEGGSVFDIICAPGDSLYIYHGNGIFRSTDHAESWQQIRKGYVSSAAVNSKNQIFASCHLDNSPLNPAYLIRSFDYGKTWDTLNSVWFWTDTTIKYWLYKRYVCDIKFDLNDKLYIIANNNVNENDISEGKFRILMSEDLGETWTFLDTSYTSPPERLVSIHPYKDSTYAIRKVIRLESLKEKELICITHDNGKTYTTFQFQKDNGDQLIQIQYLSHEKIFVAYYKSLFYSYDGGANWIEVSKPNETNWIRSLHAVTDSIFYLTLGNGFIYKTTDLGLNWIKINEKKLLVSFYPNYNSNFTYDSKQNLYISDPFGVKKSVDSGRTFQRKSHGYVNTSAIGIAPHDIVGDKKGNLYFGYNGLYISRDNGKTWLHKELNEHLFHVLLPLKDGSILAYGSNQIYRSTDEGETWELWNDNSVQISDMVENKDGILFATQGHNFVFRSTDKGKTWENLINSVAGKAIGINSDGILNALNEYSGIYQSTDNGDSWFKTHEYGSIDEKDLAAIFNPMLFHPSKRIGFTGRNTFFRTTDNGSSWKFYDAFEPPERPSYHHFELAVDSLGNFWAGYCRSTDDGETWEKVISGIDSTHLSQVFSMGVSKSGYIFILTKYGGIYRSRQRYASVGENTNQANKLEIEVYPNPSSGLLNLSFISDVVGDGILHIYNTLGIEVSSVNFENFEVGKNTVSVNLNEQLLSPGIYFFNIQQNSQIRWGKFILEE